MTRAAVLAVAFCSALALGSQVGLAGDRDERPKKTTATQGQGSIGDVFEGVGGWFSDDDESGRPIDALGEGKDYAGIAARRALSIRILHGYATGLMQYPGFGDYANSVLNRLIAAIPVRNLPARVYMVASGNFSAGAMPCGAIALDWGLLRGLRFEDELAFVLAHELGHVVFRHHRADYFVEAQHYAITTASLTERISARLSGVTGGQPLVAGSDLDRSIRIGKVVQKVSEGLLLPAWSREQEDEADRFAIDVLVRASYNHASALSFFVALEAWEGRRETAEDEETAALIAEYVQGGAIDTTSRESLLDGLIGITEIAAAKLGGSSHYPAAERRKRIQQYIVETYASARLAPRTPAPWLPGGSRDLGRAHAQFESAAQSLQSLGSGNPGEAAKLAAFAVDGAMSAEGFPRFAFYNVRRAAGEADKAKANLDLALKAAKPGVLFWKERMLIAESEGKLAEAAALLDEARRRLDDPPALIPDRIRIYPKVGRAQEATPLLVECELQWREMVDECEAEGKRLAI